MMSFLALNSQVAEASVAMHEMPIATATKEMAIRQAMAFPFLVEDMCIGRPRPSCRGLDERVRQRGKQFDEALSLVRRADRRLARKQTVEQLQFDCAHPETPQDRALQNRRGGRIGRRSCDIPERDTLRIAPH